jgi:predicted DCC family thiol-disulfide oxidoreductase YuxK
MNTPTLALYYDGLCPLCSREIDHYRKLSANDPSIVYVDIAATDFDAAAHSLDAKRIHQVIHVKVGETIFTGLDAFIEVWKRMPGFRWMARVASWPVFYQMGWMGYIIFAKVRPLLPRRKANCDSGTCQR